MALDQRGIGIESQHGVALNFMILIGSEISLQQGVRLNYSKSRVGLHCGSGVELDDVY